MKAGGIARAVVTLGGALAVVPSAAVAILATRPRLAAKVFGGPAAVRRHPRDVGLHTIDAEYAPGCMSWWIPVEDAIAAVVIVHGFETAEDPRSADPAPRLELAEMLAAAGFSSLVISLGYGTGVHPHSGGAIEALDIEAAVRWARAKAGQPVAIVGFSAGGHASVVAAASPSCEVFAVVTDSSFVDFTEVVRGQAVDLLGIPAALLGLVPRFMAMLTGQSPVNLEHLPITRGIPMLHVHGDADQAIARSNQDRMVAVSGGEAAVMVGADHVNSLRVDPQGYERVVVGFLISALTSALAGAPSL